MDRVEVDGLTIAFEPTGKGSPLVLLPGYVGDGRGQCRHQIEGLSNEFHGRGVGYAGFRTVLRPTRVVPASRLRRLSHRVHGRARIPQGRTSASSLILAGAYAGWAGSLPPDVADARLQQVLQLADLPPDRFVVAVVGSMFSASVPGAVVEAFAASIDLFHAVGLRSMARDFAEADLRDSSAPLDGSREPACLDPRLQTRRPPRGRARQPRRGSRAVQPRGSGPYCATSSREVRPLRSATPSRSRRDS